MLEWKWKVIKKPWKMRFMGFQSKQILKEEEVLD